MNLSEAYLYGKLGKLIPVKGRMALSDAWLAKQLFGGGGGTPTTLLWQTPPVSLTGAIAKALKFLVQYGVIEQDSTPSPTSPVALCCNNGELVVVDDELPVGYTRLQDIEFDGDFHYETGQRLTGDDDVTMTLADTKTTGQNIFGSYNGTASGAKNFSLFIYGNGSASGSYLRYGEQLLRPKYGAGERTITFGKSGTSGFATDASATPETFTTPANAYIGMLPNSTSPAFSGTIVGNITVGTRLRYIPSERDSDGTIGYYEIINGEFLAPVGTGTPSTTGYDTSHLTKIKAVGTPEVLTLSASGAADQTASAVDLFAAGDYMDTHDIITGSVMRYSKAVILTGEENWADPDSSRMYSLQLADCLKPSSARSGNIACSHYPVDTASSMADKTCRLSRMSSSSTNGMLIFKRTDITSVTNWKNWLKAQLAAGTPVIVIYPLKESIEETVAAQKLVTAEGDNTISITAEVSGIPLDVCYYTP